MAEFDPDAFLAKKEKRGGFDPDAFLAKTAPETAAQTFGRSAASLADTALNAITGTLDYGAYALARAAGRTPEQATAETTSPKDVVGRAFGVTGTSGYENAPLRSAGRVIGETLGENVIQPVANVTGIPEADVGNMLNSLAMGVAPVAGRSVAPVGRAVKSVAQVPVDVARGAVGRATGYIAEPGATPRGYQVPSSRVPLGETYIPAEAMSELQRGMPISESSIRPISELAPGPVLALSGGEIPVAGQAARAFGERLGETYSNPYTAAADIGSMFLTGGVPVLTAGRGALGLAQAGADAYLARKGFTSLTPEQRATLNAGGNPFYVPPTAGPVAPTAQPQPATPAGFPVSETAPLLPYTPAGQTAMPMPGPGRRVNIEGESFNLPYEIDTGSVQAARPQVNFAAQQGAEAAAAARAAAEFEARSAANKQRVADQLAAQREVAGPAVPVEEPTTIPVVDTTAVAPIVEAAPVAERVYTAAEVRRMLPRRAGESAEAFEARVQAVLAAQPKVEIPPVITTEPTKRKYTKQEDTIKELEAKLTAEEKAAQDAMVERQLAKTRGKQAQGTGASTELPKTSVESLKQKMKQPEKDPAMEEALRQRLEALKNKNKPASTMEMMSGLPEFESKQAFLEQKVINELAGKPTVGTFVEGKKRFVYETEGVGPFEMVNVTEFDAKTGKKLGPTKRISMKRIDGK